MDEKDLSKQIGNRLKILRHFLNLTQLDFAKQINRTQREVSTWENGKKLMPLFILFTIKQLYDVPIGYFDPEDDKYFAKVFGGKT